ncbi:MAG: ABC transporter ATP-binding protein [Thermoplasmata archaeon]
MPALLEARDLWKSYDGAAFVLQDVHLRVDTGEGMVVWGRNGSGKTTLLDLLGGLDWPDRGQILLRGRDLARLSPREQAAVRLDEVGFVFQDHNLLEELTVRQNVQLPLRLRRAPHTAARGEALLARFGLEALAERRPPALSTGERQKVAVARALANEPDLLLADEPTASLDEESARDLLHLLEELREDGRTIILASHDPLSRTLSWPVRRLQEGRLGRPGGGEG